MRLGFDCDDVLTNYTSALAQRYNQQYGTSYQPEDITPLVRGWGERLGPEMERRLWEISTNDEFCLTLNPVAGAVESIATLNLRGDELYVVTGREKTPRAVTMQWLERHFGTVFRDVFQGGSVRGRTKGEIAQYLGVAAFVEDIPHHIRTVQDAEIPVIVLDYAWNRDVPEGNGISRAHGWKDIVSLVSQVERPQSL